MNRSKFPKHLLEVILVLVLLAGCVAPAPTPVPPPIPQPGNPPPPTSAQLSLFKFIKSVDVTPVGNLAGGLFVRIGYVPERERIIVTFKAKLGQAKGGCADVFAYAYREYTEDMQETGNYGVITCQTGPDVGGLVLGNDFYYAAMGHDNVSNVDGWYLAKYNAVTWTTSVRPFFYPLAPGELNDDPMIAVVNGQLDISSHYKRAGEIGPGHATHHQFFTPNFQFVSKRVLTDTSHINLTSLLAGAGVINFITSTDLWGDMIVIQYDASWNYLGQKTLKVKASAPEGAAFDGPWFYVSYIDNSLETPGMPGGNDNIRLAAFDSKWNLLDDIAVTSFVPGDHKAPARPSLTLRNNRIYVCYDEGENAMPNQTPETADLQVHVKVYELMNSGR